tara:strand:+ start:490 stop:1194 length:705 start_codon:yes stop_codon:yes gene_type:complete
MYDITGKRCIESLLNNTDFEIIVMLEDMDKLDIESERITCYSIYDLGYFENIKSKNLDVIPKHFGGNSKMKANDRNNYYNFNSINWWKKIASMYIANEKAQIDTTLIWIDADCFLLRKVSSEFFDEQLFKGQDMFYFKGKRDACESGLVGFKKDHAIMVKFFEYFKNDFPFRKLPRYDDGYVLGVAIKDCKSGNAIDLNVPHIERHPLKKFKKYIKHEKGTHRDKGIHVDTRKK